MKEQNDLSEVNGRSINNIRFVDDTALIAKCLDELQRMVPKQETQFMVITKAQQRQESHRMHGEQIKVQNYKYLRTITNENNECTEEIKPKIGQGQKIIH